MTIYALSTVPGKSGVAIIRVSGKLAKKTIKILTKKNTKPRNATLCKIYDNKNKIIDEAVVIYYENDKSFTGEPVAEFQTHGSLSVLSKLLDELSLIKGLRQAEPGEFTKKAYLSGKINLVQAEGLADLIDSETEKQREQALLHYGSEVTDKYLRWSEQLKTSLALIEASIDFSDEDIPKNLLRDIKGISSKIKKEMSKFLETEKNAHILKDGIKIAIIGKTNSGKSSLINYLSREKISIVSHKPGTTRDILRSQRIFLGIPVTIIDTAGIRNSQDAIEKEGLEMAKKEQKLAHIKVYLGSNNEKNPFQGVDMDVSDNDIVVINKTDLKKKHNFSPNISISLKDNRKVSLFEKKLEKKIKNIASTNTGAFLTKKRQKTHLIKAIELLDMIDGSDLEIISLHTREALKNIDSITTETDNEEVLGIIFSKFCIGK
ncbi:MAG: tRNA uridine-5-carboxymethylaminomethyl(34) synthesis GTPase MnmE [Rhizobiales bacterium TMED168]|nr:MAG: tRNA uridine-5-carboxymethylaminomethyl(34) synthesis GTPase MnmE [Rhizobiales bacterium TMED168]|tara:strand:- start:19040 stop:20338 length:1299 start_codon:yes stop_codon:yes gene_type:complete